MTWSKSEVERMSEWNAKILEFTTGTKSTRIFKINFHGWIACELGRCNLRFPSHTAGFLVKAKLYNLALGQGEPGTNQKRPGMESGVTLKLVVESLLRLGGCATTNQIYQDLKVEYPGVINLRLERGKKNRTSAQGRISFLVNKYLGIVFRAPEQDRRWRKTYEFMPALLGCESANEVLSRFEVEKKAKRRTELATKRKAGIARLNAVKAFGQVAGR